MNVKCRAFALAQFSSGQSIVSKKFKLITQLTLFPRVSKTGETNLWIQRTPFREHFVEHGFFQHAKLVILTLMKGDKVVEPCQILANLVLFLQTGQPKLNAH